MSDSSKAKQLKEAINSRNTGNIRGPKFTEEFYDEFKKNFLNDKKCYPEDDAIIKEGFDAFIGDISKMDRETKERFMKLRRDVEFCNIRNNKTLCYALENGYIDPGIFLVTILKKLTSPKDVKSLEELKKIQNFELMMLAFTLRYADANSYLLVPGYGEMHVLIFAIIQMDNLKIGPNPIPIGKTLKNQIENDFAKQVVLLFMLMGVNITFKALRKREGINVLNNSSFDARFVKAASERESLTDWDIITVGQILAGLGEYEGKSPIDLNKSVKTTFKNFNIDYSSPFDLLRNLIPKSGGSDEFIVKFGLLIDDPEFAVMTIGGDTYQPSFAVALEYNAIKVIKSMKFEDVYIGNESSFVLMSMNALSIEAFTEVVMRGGKVPYFTMNRLLLEYKKYTEKGDKFNLLRSEIYLGMIKNALSLGVPIDNYQLEFLSVIIPREGKDNKSVAEELRKIYQKPLWKKVCRGSENSPIPKSLKLLAVSMGIMGDPYKMVKDVESSPDSKYVPEKMTKKDVCFNISERVNELSVEEFKVTARKDLTNMIASTTITMRDFGLDRKEGVNCINPVRDIYGEPLDYANNTLAYYKDNLGSLYCFASPMFPDLINTEKNPYTGERLDLEILLKMQKLLVIYKSLDIDPVKILPAYIAFRKIKEEEVISNDRTDYAKTTVELVFNSRGFRVEDLRLQTSAVLNNLLAKVEMSQGYLANLEGTKLLFPTFCKAFYSGLKRAGPEKTAKMLRDIEINLKSIVSTKT